MLSWISRAGIGAVLTIALASCAAWNEPKLEQPTALASPYRSTTEIVWAVAPLANESGTSLADELIITDALVEQIRQVDGLTALPTNRTLGALRAMGVASIGTPEEARLLAQTLGADGVIVGALTSWDPYHPPRLGMNLVLFARGGSMRADAVSERDLLILRTAATEIGIRSDADGDAPVAGVAEHVDASNHAVLMDIKQYATGRHDPRSALGWELYTQSMGRFTEYVCFRMVRRLLERESERLMIAEARAD